VLRNYAMEYITSILPDTIAVLGPDEGGHLAGAAARLAGMHTFYDVAALLGGVEPGLAGFKAATTHSSTKTQEQHESDRRPGDSWRSALPYPRRSSMHGTSSGWALHSPMTGSCGWSSRNGETTVTTSGSGS
jgi:hypothetical protein